jgi:hypothetical protein
METTLIQKAIQKHGKIFPCSNKKSLLDCFTVEGEQIIFWYNTEDQTTHVLVSRA